MQQHLSLIDKFVLECDRTLRVMHGNVTPSRPTPLPPEQDSSFIESTALTAEEEKHAAGLMRVNHVGEVCAQALYQAQRLTSKSEQIRVQLEQAAKEEEDHLAWCKERLTDLNARPSLLNPVWYAGSFALGILAGLAGDRWSLGFVAETEKQVVEHLDSHVERLPAGDLQSLAIVKQMRLEEAEHRKMALDSGGKELPNWAKKIMLATSKVMTTLAYRL